MRIRKKKDKGEKVHKILMICPECKEENKVKSVDYVVNNDQDGVVFIYQCSLCKENFKIEKKYMNM